MTPLASAAIPSTSRARLSATAPQWLVVVRVYGSILYTTGKWGGKPGQAPIDLEPAHIDEWMSLCAKAGVTTVLWRANCAGTLTYPSAFTGLAGEPPLPPKYRLGTQVIDQGWSVEDWEFLGKQCRRFNTLEVAVKGAHKYGLRFILDFHTFDLVGVWCTADTWPSGGPRKFDPDLWLWSRDQKERLAGVPCYADPRVRQLRLAEIDEALAYGIDGVFFGFFSHCDAMSTGPANSYGLNPCVVEEYVKRHGSPPGDSDEDIHRLYALHGEHFTGFLREAAARIHARGKEVLCTTRTDSVHGWGAPDMGGAQGGLMGAQDLRDPSAKLGYAAGFCLEWEKWCAENLVDALVAYAPFPDTTGAVAKIRRRAGKPVHVMRKYSGWQGKLGGGQTLENYRAEIDAVRRGELDGYALHLMMIPPHESAVPDWRDLLAPPKEIA